MEHMVRQESNMENAHDKVEEIASRKCYEESKAALIRMAQEDIHSFILHCQAKGFSTGIKIGFVVGVFVSLLFYLLTK